MTDAYNPPKAELQDRYGSLRGQVSVGILEQLRRSRPWVRLISVVGIISSLFTLAPGVVMLLGGTMMYSQMGDLGAGLPSSVILGIGMLYILMGIITLIAFIKLFGYASSITRAANAADAAEVETALRKLAGFWKYAGILLLITIVLSLVGMATAIAIPFYMGAGFPM